MTTSRIIRLGLLILLSGCGQNGNRNPGRETSQEQSSLTDFYSINDSNQTNIFYAPDFNKVWFDSLDKKFSWVNFDPYHNRYWEYTTNLFDTLPSLAKDSYKSDKDFFNKLTRGQKVFYSILVFEGEVDNGGVWQFFFNKPEFCFAALESFQELKLDTLARDYEKCLNEFIGSSDSYSQRKNIFSNEKINWEKRWKSFTDGYGDIKSAKKLEDYFFKDEFKKKFYKTAVDYIDNHLDQFVKK